MEGSYFIKGRDMTTYHGCQQCLMMIISLSWGCHGVTCCCHKLLMSRKLSRGCVTCCPHQGSMCTGSDAPLVTRRLSLRMRRSDQQVVARLARTAASETSHCHTYNTSSQPHYAFKDAKSCPAISHQIGIHSNSMLSCSKAEILNPWKVFPIWLTIISVVFSGELFLFTWTWNILWPRVTCWKFSLNNLRSDVLRNVSPGLTLRRVLDFSKQRR